jgi:hypothetical protein
VVKGVIPRRSSVLSASGRFGEHSFDVETTGDVFSFSAGAVFPPYIPASKVKKNAVNLDPDKVPVCSFNFQLSEGFNEGVWNQSAYGRVQLFWCPDDAP